MAQDLATTADDLAAPAGNAVEGDEFDLWGLALVEIPEILDNRVTIGAEPRLAGVERTIQADFPTLRDRVSNA